MLVKYLCANPPSLAEKLVMGGAAGFFLALMLFIGFKYKLNMTTHHLAYSAQ